MTATLPGCAAEPLHVIYGSEQHAYECGCGYRTPRVADARTARQAIDTHRTRPSLCTVTCLHDPDDMDVCRDCGQVGPFHPTQRCAAEPTIKTGERR